MIKRSKMLILASLSAIAICTGGLHSVHDWNPLEVPPDREIKYFKSKRTKPQKKKLNYRKCKRRKNR